MESVKQEASKVLDKDKNDNHSISNWSDVVKDIVDKLTGKDMEKCISDWLVPNVTRSGYQPIGSGHLLSEK